VTGLPDREAAVLAVLEAAGGRVVSRTELARAAGLDGLSRRRVDGVLVRLRRVLPDGALVTVRGRGWALVPAPGVHRVGTLRKRAGHPGGTPAAYGP
jgi:DNA-binding response OmpR family regulator